VEVTLAVASEMAVDVTAAITAAAMIIAAVTGTDKETAAGVLWKRLSTSAAVREQ